LNSRDFPFARVIADSDFLEPEILGDFLGGTIPQIRSGRDYFMTRRLVVSLCSISSRRFGLSL